MDDLVELSERPVADEKHMIAGWRQWADAGGTSSELPRYLVRQMGAKRIGRIKPDGFYLFQIPGTRDLLRPTIKLHEGHRKELQLRRNDLFYAGDARRGLFIFLGEEPHRNVERYAETFFDVVEGLGVKTVAAIGGVHGPVPYHGGRRVSCVYSLPSMKAELARYSVKFSDYKGAVSIGMYLADTAERRGVEYLALCALVPWYDFQQRPASFQAIQLERDFRAWYDLVRRLDRMFDLGMDLSDLRRKSKALVAVIDAQIDELDRRAPQLGIREHIEELTRGFEGTPSAQLSDVWKSEIRDLFRRS